MNTTDAKKLRQLRKCLDRVQKKLRKISVYYSVGSSAGVELRELADISKLTIEATK